MRCSTFLVSVTLGAVLAGLAREGAGQGYSPLAAAGHMTLAPDLEVRLVASEPLIAQPVCIEFDDRGRLWVVQYLQYPNPAGLKRAAVDRWSRTTYERVPEPPPKGPKGADRITILDDSNTIGPATKSHDFVKDLNLASGIAFGHGGVFVLNVPYLLFYPDRNQDDVPDGDPTVCLTGFGMEDAHSIANSLTWGPDGWLYGCQGSTVTAHVRGTEFQQGIWRYHPITHEFELFCEGGGNSWGLDFDAEGELIYSTNLGPYRNLHGVQGAYYWKSFGKHGALHNPYAFGFFDHIPHTNFTGGHVTDGGIIYQGTNLPARFVNHYICGDLLGHGVQWEKMYRWGSTFTSSYGATILEANDNWFASTDVTMAPDGTILVADWCDKRTAHPDPDADWDRSNGRIYRISAKGTIPAAVPDLTKLSTLELIDQLRSENDWIVRKARRLLADRRDARAIAPLRKLVLESKDDHLALESLWALYVSGGFDSEFAGKTLSHRSGPIRKWAVRLLGDERKVSDANARQLVSMAKMDPDVRVRMQLASSAQRLPAKTALPILEALLLRDEDGSDPYLPLLLWWGVEHHSVSALPEVEKFFTSAQAWKSGLVREVILERLTRRWIAEGTEATRNASARLLAAAPDEKQAHRLLAAMEQGFHDRPEGAVTFGSGGLFANTQVAEVRTNSAHAGPKIVTAALAEKLRSYWRDDTADAVLIWLNARTGHAPALARARELVGDSQAHLDLRLRMIQLLGEMGNACDAQQLISVAISEPEQIQVAAIEQLPLLNPPELDRELIQRYGKLSVIARAHARQVLLSSKTGARAVLAEVDAGRIPAADFTVEQLRVVALHEDAELNDLVRKRWGRITPGTAEEKLAEMRRWNNDLNAGNGNAAIGREIFGRTCAVCHTLFNEGKKVGPDLTHANRADREFLLGSIVDPSASIRKEYLAYQVETKDGRMLSGVITEQTSANLTLATSAGEFVSVPQSQIASLRESAVSLMPEGLLKTLKAQELRDLFSYLQSTAPISK